MFTKDVCVDRSPFYILIDWGNWETAHLNRDENAILSFYFSFNKELKVAVDTSLLE